MDKSPSRNVEKKLSECDPGIKLFKSSKVLLTKEEEYVETDNKDFRKKRKLNKSLNHNEHVLKCQEAAVSPEDVLLQLDSKHWVNRKMGQEFRYKKQKDGTLVEIKDQMTFDKLNK